MDEPVEPIHTLARPLTRSTTSASSTDELIGSASPEARSAPGGGGDVGDHQTWRWTWWRSLDPPLEMRRGPNMASLRQGEGVVPPWSGRQRAVYVRERGSGGHLV